MTCLRVVLGRYQRRSLTLFAFVQAYVAEVIRYTQAILCSSYVPDLSSFGARLETRDLGWPTLQQSWRGGDISPTLSWAKVTSMAPYHIRGSQ